MIIVAHIKEIDSSASGTRYGIFRPNSRILMALEDCEGLFSISLGPIGRIPPPKKLMYDRLV